jgi:long-chain fatty acid transport protein
MRETNLRSGLSVFMIVLCIFCASSNTFGSGFGIYTQGASPLGQGVATIAHTDDPSAIFWNPALINKLEGTQVQLGTTIIFPSREFKSDSGQTFRTEPAVFFPSTFFVTHKFNNELSAGLGVFNPFGLATTWPDDWEGRYLATNSEMTTFNFNPVVSYQITPKFAVAAGIDFLLLDATLERKINLSALTYPTFPDGGQKFEGDGNGVGYNFGLLIEPHKDIAIGISYRSEIKVDIDGDVTFDLPPGSPPGISLLFPNAGANTDITLPQQVHAGVCYKGLYPLTLEVAVRWEGWSSFDQLKIKFDKLIAGYPESVEKKDWKDTWSGNIGMKYQVSEPVALLAGYLYQDNPIPDKTFEPAIPDANGHLFTIGTDVKLDSFRLGLAYGYQILQNRVKNNAITDPITKLTAFSANGTYKSHLHMVGVSLTYTF